MMGHHGWEIRYGCIETRHGAIEIIFGHLYAEVKYNMEPTIKLSNLKTKK